MTPKYLASSLALAVALPLHAQVWTEVNAGDLPTGAEAVLGSGPLTTINGELNTNEVADVYLIQVDDPASFTCSSVGGATFDTQLWMFDTSGNGISFRDDDVGLLRSTLSGQFLGGPGRVLIAISAYDNDARDSNGSELWLDTPFNVERQPDGPGTGAFSQWNGNPVGAARPYALTLTGASLINADPGGAKMAWAWINSTSGSTIGTVFVPSTYYQRTTTGELVTVDHLAQGQYEVRFPASLNGNGAPIVTAYGGNHTTVIQAWGPLVPDYMSVFVDVLDTSGALVNGSFCIQYRQRGLDTDRAAYCWANDATSPSYTVSNAYSFNGNRGSITINRFGIGNYQVIIPGLGTNSGEYGNVQVSAYSGHLVTQFVRAKVDSWGPIGADLSIGVRTFDGAGAPIDARYVVSYQEAASPMPTSQGSGAHVWANDASSPSYTPHAWYTDSNGTLLPGGPITITRSSTGNYTVTLPGLAPSSSSMAVATAYGSSSTYATISSWNGPSNSTSVAVRTFDTTGSPADSQFTLMYTTDDPAGTSGANTIIGTGCEGLLLNPGTRPVLNQDWELSLANLPATSVIGLVSLGFTNPNIPLDFLGAPGCWAYQDQVSLTTVFLPSPVPSYSLTIPSTVTLVGLNIFAQGGVFASGINALSLATSNGVMATIGDV